MVLLPARTCTVVGGPDSRETTARSAQHRRKRQCVARQSASGSETAAARGGSAPSSAPTVGRRSTLLASLQAVAAALVLQPPAQAAPQEQAVVTVGSGGDCATITEALQLAPPGATVEVGGGRYVERLVITQAVTIRAAPGQAVELMWQTSQPYQATVECGPELEGAAVLLQGLRIRHSSPSIANNYAVKLSGCNAVLADCDISSATGDGVGIEGGAPGLLRCTVHNCQRHGVAVFGDLLGGGCAADLDACSLVANRLSGLLVRDGAAPAVHGCTLSSNGEWGLRLVDASGEFRANTIAANTRGSVGCSMLGDDVDTARVTVDNKLDRPVQYV